MSETLPLFPLSTLLYPGGRLALRLFEPRYLDMLTRCFKEDSGFGVVLLENGSEVGADQSFFNVGTEARIVDWGQGDDGMLHITARGGRRFAVEASETREDNLVVGAVSWLVEPDDAQVPEAYAYLAEFLDKLIERTGADIELSDAERSSALALGYRLAEVLPLEARAKVELLASSDPIERLQQFDELFQQAAVED